MTLDRAFAKVAVFSSGEPSTWEAFTHAFTYHVPDKLLSDLKTGSLVVVPFGSRRLYGIIVAFSKESPVPETRPIESLVDPDPVVTPTQIALARWMSREYLTSLWRCLALMLPPGVVGHADEEVELTKEVEPRDVRSVAQEQLVTVLDSRGPMVGRQLDRLLPRQQWRRAATQLARRGFVVRSPFLAPAQTGPRTVRTVQLNATADVKDGLTGLRSEVYQFIIAFLQAERDPVDVSWVYAETGCTRYHLNKLAERGIVAFDVEEVWRDPLADEIFVPDTPPALTSDQQSVWTAVKSAICAPQHTTVNHPPRVLLIHGVTGSGKTEIYLRAVAEVLARKQQAIVLVPEISLTPQTAHRFGARFGRRIAVLHSGLTVGERYDTWRRIRAGQVDAVIGARSALFAPHSSPGLIILDEEHEGSYKQDAPPPRYHAREVALALARITGATVILGSATPSLESYHRAQRGEFKMLQMPRRIMGHTHRLHDLQARYSVPRIHYSAGHGGSITARYMPLPPVQVVDLRAELRAGNRSIFSRALQGAMDGALKQGEQVILFLNRRGTATCVLCRDCGYVPHCPRCDTPLTYHRSRARLVCHHCNHRQPQPNRCPQCGSGRIRYFGLGTEQVEEAIHQRWPDVRTLRWDQDTARNHAAHAAILHLFSTGLAHVLVGTQMIAKGLDLPLVTVVGVVSADTALNLPDFRSGEHTAQLLTQVAGRAGRGLLGGRVIIQTYNPDHYAIVAAAAHDYAGFAARELAFRRDQGYPPYRRLAKLVYEDDRFSHARAEAKAFASTLREALEHRGIPTTDLTGPVFPFFARLRGRYRWQMLLRHSDPGEFLRSIPIPPGWRVDIDPMSVL
jgi:primosomal protein N' (replication factor Y)